MDIKQKYREETNLEPYFDLVDNYVCYTKDYVKWLEEKLLIQRVSQQRELLKAFDDWCDNNEGELSSLQDVYIDKFFNSL